jgi:glyoxylase-like metal-dependent hydrolase (beta-lactamase superfamily II)
LRKKEGGEVEVLPGVHRIESEFDDTRLSVHLLWGQEPILIDTGVVTTPEQAILPYLAGLSDPARLTSIIVTHAHADHFGGAHKLKQALPGAKLLVHELDAEWVEDHERHLTDFCDQFAEGHDMPADPGYKTWLRSLLGDEAKVDQRLKGGETVRVDEGWDVEIIHTPGHSLGDIVVYDPVHRCAFSGEPVQGKGIVVGGKVAHPPLYVDVDDYLATISTLRELALDYLFDLHQPILKGDAICEFLDESERAVQLLEATIGEFLESARRPVALKEVTERASQTFGPYDSLVIAKSTVYAHLMRLVRLGSAGLGQTKGLTTWEAS